MSAEDWVGLVVAVLLTAYVLVALVKPERF